VRVRAENQLQRWRRPHLRTPGYIFGAVGTIERYCGAFGDPEFIAFRGQPSQQHLYRLRFERGDLWDGSEQGTVDVEVYESWLLPVATAESAEGAEGAGAEAGSETSLARKRGRAEPGTGSDGHDHNHDHGHSHDDHTDSSKGNGEDNQASTSAHTHDHGHTHDDRTTTEQNACDKEAAANGGAAETIGKRVAEALVSVLTAGGQSGHGSGDSDATPERAILTKAEVARAIENVDAMGTNVIITIIIIIITIITMISP
jgi:nitrile hydratase